MSLTILHLHFNSEGGMNQPECQSTTVKACSLSNELFLVLSGINILRNYGVYSNKERVISSLL